LAASHARSDKDYSSDMIDYSFEKHALKAIEDTKGWAKKIAQLAYDYEQQLLLDYTDHYKKTEELCKE
jgi:hypothetical protein